MAKKKSKKKQQPQIKISPHRYMREKARTLPIGKCYIGPSSWHDNGLAQIIITRVRPSGNLVMALFLVDTFCLGVKDATFNENLTPDDFQLHFDSLNKRIGLEEISYNEAHNIIYGAMAFAEDAGIKPTGEFYPAGYILEEDTDDIPMIEYEFGKNGKHFLVVNPDHKEMPYYHILKKNLGDNFEYVLPFGEELYNDDDDDEDYDDYDEDDYDEDEDCEEEDYPTTPEINLKVKEVLKKMIEWKDEYDRNPKEIFSYQYPEYPQTLSVKNQFIADEFLATDNTGILPLEVIERILALPKDEAAQDISNIMLYEIGRTYNGINDGTIDYIADYAIIFSLVLLAQLQSDKGLDAILELMCQTSEFVDYHLGDFVVELIHPALYASGLNNIKAIEDYLNQPGHDSFLRSQASEALAMIVYNHPARREEIIAVFQRLLKSMVTRLPKQEACDGLFAGLLMSTLLDINPKELIPEIKAVFATNCVDKTIAGDCESVINHIKPDYDSMIKDKFTIPKLDKPYRLRTLNFHIAGAASGRGNFVVL